MRCLLCSKDPVDHLLLKTQAAVGESPFGPFTSVARGHSRELHVGSYEVLRFEHVLH